MIINIFYLLILLLIETSLLKSYLVCNGLLNFYNLIGYTRHVMMTSSSILSTSLHISNYFRVPITSHLRMTSSNDLVTKTCRSSVSIVTNHVTSRREIRPVNGLFLKTYIHILTGHHIVVVVFTSYRSL